MTLQVTEKITKQNSSSSFSNKKTKTTTEPGLMSLAAKSTQVPEHGYDSWLHLLCGSADAIHPSLV